LKGIAAIGIFLSANNVIKSEIKNIGASPRGMNWRILLKNCEASLGELNPLEGLMFYFV